MDPLPAEIYNRFDRAMKAFADEAPRMLLHLLGVVPKDDPAEIVPVRRETAPPPVFPDYVALLEVRGARPFLFHAEFQLRYWWEQIQESMALYGGGLALEYKRRVLSYLLLLRPEGIPDVIPRIAKIDLESTRLEHDFKTVRLWEIDPAVLLESGDPRLFPWAVLMKSSDEEVREIGAALGRDGDEESIWRYLALGSLRYDRTWLEDTLGGPRMGLVEAILEGSSIVKEVTDKAVEKAVAKATVEASAKSLAEGRMEEARRLLRRALATRFPGLDSMPEIDRIESVETLENLLIGQVWSADSRDAVHQAILDATPRA